MSFVDRMMICAMSRTGPMGMLRHSVLRADSSFVSMTSHCPGCGRATVRCPERLSYLAT